MEDRKGDAKKNKNAVVYDSQGSFKVAGNRTIR